MMERKERQVLEVEFFVALFDAAHLFASQANLQWFDLIVLYYLHKNADLNKIGFLAAKRIETVIKNLKVEGFVYEKTRGYVLLTEHGTALLNQFTEHIKQATLNFGKNNPI